MVFPKAARRAKLGGGRARGMTFAIIILHFGNRATTIRCLRSVERARRASDFVMVLDASHNFGDLRGHNLTALRTATLNPGFSKAMNYGARKVRGGRFDAYAFLNNDTIVPSDYFSEVERPFRAGGARVGAVGPKIVYAADPGLVWSAGGRVSTIKMAAVQENQFRDSHAVTGTFRTSFISGCAICIRREAYEDVGGWPEAYFFGGEEWELSTRLARRGWTLLVDADTAVKHHAHLVTGQGSSHSFANLRYVLNGYLNRLLFAKRNCGLGRTLLFVAALTLHVVFVVPLKWPSVGREKTYVRKQLCCIRLIGAFLLSLRLTEVSEAGVLRSLKLVGLQGVA